jgi:hypothetical protein
MPDVDLAELPIYVTSTALTTLTYGLALLCPFGVLPIQFVMT